MKARSRRLTWVLVGVAGIGIVTALVLNAFRQNLQFSYTPTQIVAKEAPINRTFRVGGLVEKGSLQRHGIDVDFVVTDTYRSIPVRYTGILPDLFKEGKGVVAEGRLDGDGHFTASQVLAKHDENYMPPEAADALKHAADVNARLSKSLVTESGSKTP